MIWLVVGIVVVAILATMGKNKGTADGGSKPQSKGYYVEVTRNGNTLMKGEINGDNVERFADLCKSATENKDLLIYVEGPDLVGTEYDTKYKDERAPLAKELVNIQRHTLAIESAKQPVSA